MVLYLKSSPIVDVIENENYSEQNRLMMLVLPTPESPTTIILYDGFRDILGNFYILFHLKLNIRNYRLMEKI